MDGGGVGQEAEADARDPGSEEVVPTEEGPGSGFGLKAEGPRASLRVSPLGDGHPGQLQQQASRRLRGADPGPPFGHPEGGSGEDGPLGGAGLGVPLKLLEGPQHVSGRHGAAVREAGIAAQGEAQGAVLGGLPGEGEAGDQLASGAQAGEGVARQGLEDPLFVAVAPDEVEGAGIPGQGFLDHLGGEGQQGKGRGQRQTEGEEEGSHGCLGSPLQDAGGSLPWKAPPGIRCCYA